MNKKVIIETLIHINELGEKFPLLQLKQINFYELAKFYKKDSKDFLSLVVLLDCMKQTNENSTKKIAYYIDINEVSKIKVKRNQNKWVFHVHKNSNENMKLTHEFSFGNE